jgi:hypothetical protein
MGEEFSNQGSGEGAAPPTGSSSTAGREFFGWGVLLLVSASDVEAKEGHSDESGDSNLGVRGRE